MSSLRGLLDFRHREFATFMKARGSLVDTTSASVNPLPSTRPSSPDPTPYNCSSASLSSPATSSQCKSSAYRPSDKISPPIVLQKFSNSHPHTLSHSPRFMPLPSVPPDSQLAPLTGPTHTLKPKLPAALQCILNSPLPSVHPQHMSPPSVAVGNTLVQLSSDNCALRKRPRTEFDSLSPSASNKLRKLNHPTTQNVSPHVSPTTITNLARSETSKVTPFLVRSNDNQLAHNRVYTGHILSPDPKIGHDFAAAPLPPASNTIANCSRRHPGSEGEEGDENIGTASFDCELCASRFLRKHHLERHIQNIHEGQRPWTCDQCGFSFHQKPNLERHIMTVHEDQKPFRCNVCDMAFGRKGVLKKHVQMVHENSRKFECEICFIPFGLKSDLKRHVQSVHQKKRPFVCEVCSASFGRRSDLKRHTLSLHPGVEIPSQRPGNGNNSNAGAGSSRNSSNRALRTVSGGHHLNVGNTVCFQNVHVGNAKHDSLGRTINGLRHA